MDLHESFTLPPKVMGTQALVVGIKWRSQLSRGDFRCDNLTMPGGGHNPFFLLHHLPRSTSCMSSFNLQR